MNDLAVIVENDVECYVRVVSARGRAWRVLQAGIERTVVPRRITLRGKLRVVELA